MLEYSALSTWRSSPIVPPDAAILIFYFTRQRMTASTVEKGTIDFLPTIHHFSLKNIVQDKHSTPKNTSGRDVTPTFQGDGGCAICPRSSNPS